jgi:hypothetical protein
LIESGKPLLHVAARLPAVAVEDDNNGQLSATLIDNGGSKVDLQRSGTTKEKCYTGLSSGNDLWGLVDVTVKQ